MQRPSEHLKLKAGMRAPDAAVAHLGVHSSLFSLWKNSTCFQCLTVDYV